MGVLSDLLNDTLVQDSKNLFSPLPLEVLQNQHIALPGRKKGCMLTDTNCRKQDFNEPQQIKGWKSGNPNRPIMAKHKQAICKTDEFDTRLIKKRHKRKYRKLLPFFSFSLCLL
ncbi:hypothetical protein CDAR_246281 [Caerostris darwini]|uniref:Uncharacterized protein n=1 Tax=Caerostris darwini TaxID=1538125 RepID=A0AAV4W7V4_9ARAC|nr:hypothetical protein CDAR_246281 [Caerostris darwini]